jgi:hypothetical protein
MVASFACQSPDIVAFQPLSNSIPGGHTEETWFPGSVDGLSDYRDIIPASGNQIQNGSPAVTSDVVAQQNEWWDIMNDDWKDILDATANDSQSKVCTLNAIRVIAVVAVSCVLVVKEYSVLLLFIITY